MQQNKINLPCAGDPVNRPNMMTKYNTGRAKENGKT